MEKDFNYYKVPPSFQVCFNDHCPHATDCLRRQITAYIPSHLTFGPAVYPTALGADGSCRFFRKDEKTRLAWGFNKLLYNVRERDAAGIRRSLVSYLGSRTAYYRYQHGEKLLTPEQQEWILDFFRQRGCTDLEFEGYVTEYQF